MFYTVYKTTNLINGKIYIGKHQTMNVNDTYLGSGIALEKAIKKHGKKNFKKDVLFVFDNELEMNLKEREIVTEEFISTNKTYNSGIGGEGGAMFKNKKHSAETKRKISEKRKGVSTMTEEGRRAISRSSSTRIISNETRKKLSLIATRTNLNRHKKK